MSYKEHIKIDLDNLELEWVKLTEVSDEYGEMHVKAITERDKIKKRLEILGAELDSMVRKEAVLKGEKLTEAKITNQIILNEKHQKLSNDLIEANEKVNMMAHIKDDFMKKITSLKYLSELYLGNYFTDSIENKSKNALRLYDKYNNNKYNDDFNEKMEEKYSRED